MSTSKNELLTFLHLFVCLFNYDYDAIIIMINMRDFSSKSTGNEEPLTEKKPLVLSSIHQERPQASRWALDVRLTKIQQSSDCDIPDAQCSDGVWRHRAENGKSCSPLVDKSRFSQGSRKEEIPVECKAPSVLSSHDSPLCSSCRAAEHHTSAWPRSLEVSEDMEVAVEGHRYENLANIFRITGGNSGAVRTDEDVEEKVESPASSVSSVSAVAGTPAGQNTSLASLDMAVGHTVTMCKCNSVYQFVIDSVDVEPVVTQAKLDDTLVEHRPHENLESTMVSNHNRHCSRPRGEVSLLNRDLLKHCRTNRKPRSVSMPIDIVSTVRQCPADQLAATSVISGVNTSSVDQLRELQPITGGHSVSSSVDLKALRKRAYRVGLNLFNR